VKLAKSNLVITGLTANQLCFVKISAFDSINNITSGISEVLAAVPSTQNDSILLVNGFDRAITGNTYDFVRQHGTSIFNYGKFVESCTNEAVTDNLLSLANYRIVDWILGEESTANETFSTTEQSFVTAYLQQGGELFTSGSEIGWDLDHSGTTSDKQFYNNYLKASYVADAPNNTAGSCYASLQQSLANSIIGYADTVKFDNGTHGTYNVNYPDVIVPLNGSASDLHYTTSINDIACVHFAGTFTGGTKSGKMVYLAYPFETIYAAADRDSVMKYVLDFFYGNSNQTTDIVQKFDDATLRLFPNPGNGMLYVQLQENSEMPVEIGLYDLSGRKLKEETYTSGKDFVFDASEFPQGMYLLQVASGGRMISKPLSIIK
jgi:hypothetical protein